MRFIAFPLLAALLVGCADPDPSATSGAVDTVEDVSAPDASAETSDTGTADASAPSDGGPDVVEDVEEDVAGITNANAGVTEGSRLILHPDALEGFFIYGIGADPDSAITQVGNTSIGMVSVVAAVEFADNLFTIRVLDLETAVPVPGDEGVLEQYAAELLDDGTIAVDFETNEAGLEVQFLDACTYRQTLYTLEQPPLYADQLLTWAAVEIFAPFDCDDVGVPPSLGVNVHFLRRLHATDDFEVRVDDPDSPFGFFATPVPGPTKGQMMSRLPGIGPDHPDGTLTYHVTANLPPEYRITVEQVVERWNDGLAEAGLNRPFLVEDAPPGIYPWDPRYRVIFWDSSKDSGAIAPFTDSPVTGEIFASDVILWLGDMERIVESYDTFFTKFPDFDPGPVDPVEMGEMGEMDEMGDPVALQARFDAAAATLPARVLRRRIHHRRPLKTGATARAIHDMVMADFTTEEIQRYILADFLTHEIGHNLGLRHNFFASIDADHIPEGAPATSTMDYVWGLTGPGVYDIDAMRYGYGAGPLVDDYLFCTDHEVVHDPGCDRWDFGHPLTYWMGVVDDLAEKYPADTPMEEMLELAQQKRWDDLFTRLRQFVNTGYEQFDPALLVDTFGFILDVVTCDGYAFGECPYHVYFRARMGLQLLYWAYSSGGELLALPELTADQRTQLLTTYEALVKDTTQPLDLKQPLIDKLANSQVEGTKELLTALALWFADLSAPNDHQQAVGAMIAKAVSEL